MEWDADRGGIFLKHRVWDGPLHQKLSWPAHADHPGGEAGRASGTVRSHRVTAIIMRTNWGARMRGP
jgi:hypothetical protein